MGANGWTQADMGTYDYGTSFNVSVPAGDYILF